MAKNKNLGKEEGLYASACYFFNAFNDLISSCFVILLICGVFNIGEKTKILLENELNHISDDIYKDYGSISVKSVDLAKALNNIEKRLLDKNLRPCDQKIIRRHITNTIAEFQTLITALLRTKVVRFS